MIRYLITAAMLFFAYRIVSRFVRGLLGSFGAANTAGSRKDVHDTPEEADFEILDDEKDGQTENDNK
jgi:hypothetical protein